MTPAMQDYAKTAFERECGSGVRFIKVQETARGTDFSFCIVSRNSTHTIGTSPTGKGRSAIEDAAIQAGRWAKIMAERSAMAA